MSFKIGDKILLRATITDVNKDAIYPYVIDIELGEHNWCTNDYSCDSSAIVGMYKQPIDDIIKPTFDQSEKCDCLHEEYGKQVCFGTKEREMCSCGGNRSKCDFYREELKKAKEPIYAIAEHTDKGTIVTADLYRATLKTIYNMNRCDILKLFGVPQHSSVETKEDALACIVASCAPKEVVDIYEKYGEQFVIHVNDVIENVSQKKQYLVTKIDGNFMCLIAQDGEVREVHIDCFFEDFYKKIGKNMKIKEFFYGEE